MARAFTTLAENHFGISIDSDVLLKDSESTLANLDVPNKDTLDASQIQDPLDTPHEVHPKGKSKGKTKIKNSASSTNLSRMHSLPDHVGDSAGTK